MTAAPPVDKAGGAFLNLNIQGECPMDHTNFFLVLISILFALTGIFFFSFACYLVFWGCPM